MSKVWNLSLKKYAKELRDHFIWRQVFLMLITTDTRGSTANIRSSTTVIRDYYNTIVSELSSAAVELKMRHI